jgi:hypothetical protein
MSGLDAGIHDDAQRMKLLNDVLAVPPHGLRVKPGNDDGEQA